MAGLCTGQRREWPWRTGISRQYGTNGHAVPGFCPTSRTRGTSRYIKCLYSSPSQSIAVWSVSGDPKRAARRFLCIFEGSFFLWYYGKLAPSTLQL